MEGHRIEKGRVGPGSVDGRNVPRGPSRSTRASRVVLLIGLVAAALPAGTARAAHQATEAQQPHGREDGRRLSGAARISLITILPGQRVYSLFGHSAIHVSDPQRGIDATYNYGTFHFGNPIVFGATFAYGALDYWLQKGSYANMVAYYPSREGRPLVERWLDLDADRREAIFRFLEWNAQPENAYYRYDFYRDNCATRIRDLFEDILGDRLVSDMPDPEATLRRLLDPYLVGRPFLHLGMDFGQGAPADVEASARDAMFLPDYLAAWVGGARMAGPGGERSLVARTDTIGWEYARTTPTPSPPWPALLFGAVLALVLYVTVLDVRSGRDVRRWLDVPLFGLLGVAGLFLAFLWLVSLHPVTRRNVHVLWALPTHLALAWSLAGGRRWKWETVYLGAAAGLAALFLAGMPLWTQEVPVALVPLALAAGVRSAGLVLARRRRAAAGDLGRLTGSPA